MQKTSIIDKLRPYLRPPVIGAAFAAFMVLSPILLGGHIFLMLFSLGGLAIVAGGVITVAFMSFESAEVWLAIDAIKRLFRETGPAPDMIPNDMKAIIYCAQLLKEKGMRNLETVVGKIGIRDPFVRYGLNMVVSEYSADEVRAMMETAAEANYERDRTPIDILQAMTSHAPAFGMVGTLVGMIMMLGNLSDDISSAGPNLAVAFLSTLYGVLSARMVYIPAAAKLRQEVEQRRLRNHLIVEGMVMLVSKKSPMYVQDRLNSFLRPETYDYDKVIHIKPTSKAQMAAAV